jgi:hypothetical protein
MQFSLSCSVPLARESAVDTLLEYLRPRFARTDTLEGALETEVAESKGIAYIPRLYDEAVKNSQMDMLGKTPPPQLQPLLQPDRLLRLEIGNPEDLGTLRFVDVTNVQTELGDTEVEIAASTHLVLPM